MSYNDVTKEYQENYRYAQSYWEPYIKDAQVYTLAASGYTWSDNERRELAKEGREPLELNIMRRPLQFFSGYLRDNVTQVIYSPVEGSDQLTADQFTKLSYYIWDKGQGYPAFLDAYDEAFKSGISLVGIHMDYSKDFVNGDISFYKRTYNSFFLDPTFENIDLKDCGFAITRDLVTKDYAKMLLPDVDPEEIDSIGKSFRNDKFQSYQPQFSQFGRNQNLLAYDQYYRRTTRMREFLVDIETGFARDITDQDEDERKKLEAGIRRFEETRRDSDILDVNADEIPNVEIQKVERPFVELCVMLNEQHVFTGEDKTGIVETYPFAPCVCYMEPSIWMASQRIQGMASAQYSAQRQFNKRHMKIVDMMDSVISTGYKYLIGSVSDPDDLRQSGQNRVIGVDPENAPEGLNSVQELAGGGAPPALLEYQKVLDDLTLTLGNVTEASLGMDEKRNTMVSGRLAQVQIAQNLMSNRRVFDNVETTQQVLGGLVLKAIQNKYTPGKVKRILGEDPSPQFYEQQFEQYDAVVKEGVRSRSQRDAYYYELINLARDGVVDVPQSEIIRALDMAGMSDLQQAIDEQEKQRARQQEKIDEQERMSMELANAQKEEMLSLSQERRARVVSDIALAEERASESMENRADSALAKAKTISEIAKLEDDRILRVLEFVNMLERQEMSDREAVKEGILQDADEINAETEGSAENQAIAATLPPVEQANPETQGQLL